MFIQNGVLDIISAINEMNFFMVAINCICILALPVCIYGMIDMKRKLQTKLDRSLEKQSRLEAFVSNASHELKTPMTSMKILCDSILEQQDVSQEIYREFMTDISSEIDRENNIIEDLLILTKMDNGEKFHLTNVSLKLLLEKIVKSVQPIAENKGVSLEYGEMPSLYADVDERKISMAITNIVENAIKYNKENGMVTISLYQWEQKNCIRISDMGIGIPREAQEKIFERFYRVDKNHSRELGGTGLGLAITKDIIEKHHGNITVESEEGKGSVFTITLPVH